MSQSQSTDDLHPHRLASLVCQGLLTVFQSSSLTEREGEDATLTLQPITT